MPQSLTRSWNNSFIFGEKYKKDYDEIIYFSSAEKIFYEYSFKECNPLNQA